LFRPVDINLRMGGVSFHGYQYPCSIKERTLKRSVPNSGEFGYSGLKSNATKNCVFSLRINSKAKKHKSARSRLGLGFSPLEWTLAY
jgi:hypothetical protein